ncbi:MAG: DUF4860 domain-containing protein [Clostridiales bacterium]|nr:DUF4860 domain-containing protein [Clostridiales bacterium]
MLNDKKGIVDIITVATVTVLFVVIISLVVFAARGYQHASEVQEINSNSRAVGSYVVNCVKDSNTSEVAIETISGTECLVIRSSDGYEHRIFMIDGKLLEEYVEAGADIDPETALEIGTTDTFELELRSDGLLTVKTDEGVSIVNTKR